MRKVILESPYAGDVPRNRAYALRALRDCLDLGEAPLASHLLYTQCLDDNVPAERELGIEAGLTWAESADAAVFYLDYGMSPGMHKALARFSELRLAIDLRYIGPNPEGEVMPNYTDMQAGDMLKALGDDGQKWAQAFMQIITQIGRDKIDEGLMISWFANAIEHSSDVRRWRKLTPIREAVARGWCAEQNAGKEMDSDLAEAIAREIEAYANLTPA